MSNISIGALHIHSKYSDGTSAIKEIALAAKKTGLSWIIITDHNNIEGLKNGEEGWYNGVAVLIGEEISPENSDHYLALNIKQEISEKMPPESFIQEVKKQGGIGFIAHPDENLARKNNLKPLRWRDWDIQGFDGIEIWNYLSDWVDNFDSKKAFWNYFLRQRMLNGPTLSTLEWWDRLNNSSAKIIPAIGGVDAHALEYKFLGIKFKVFPYYESFKTVTNCLYLDNELSKSFEQAKIQIINALRDGKNTIINKIWNNKENFDFFIENKEKQAFPGNSIKLDKQTKAVINLSKKAKIKLIHNSKLIQEYTGKELIFKDLIPGKYRVEVFYKNHPWIFTNPIQIII
ncbi:MAG: CehA/McbA family metallohydrolase [bacterium]